MSILVTGGCGFIGSNYIEHLYMSDTCNIVNVDCLTYAADVDNISQDIQRSDRYTLIEADINDTDRINKIVNDYNVEAIVNFAAESHVDNSISNSDPFIHSNICGTHSLLKVLLQHKQIKKYVQVSTDEVYGTLQEQEPAFTESHDIKPNSPYSASKAAADLLCRSFFETYKLPICVTRCSNNYGPNQNKEKLIPLMIHKAKNNEPLPVYGDGRNIRDWIHVSDHCKAIDKVLRLGVSGDVYNIGGNNEIRNIDIVKKILNMLGKSHEQITYVQDRLGHDWRYAIDNTKITTQLNWKPTIEFDTGIKQIL